MAGKVMVSRQYVHKATGRTASFYGAHPASGAPGDQTKDWEVKETGFTVQWPDGTIGCIRSNDEGDVVGTPFPTREEAQDFADARPRFPGYMQD